MAILFSDVKEFPDEREIRAYFATIEEGYEYAKCKGYIVIGHNTMPITTAATLAPWQFHYENRTLRQLYGHPELDSESSASPA